jgi:membrane-bound lytic murein transglycosylase D
MIMRKFLTTATLALAITAGAGAQNYSFNYSGANTAPVPNENVMPSSEVLMQDYNNRTYLRENVSSRSVVRTSDASDLTIEQRLKRIQTTMDLPLNDITRGYIDKYANKMKRSIGVMLASMNFYRPIFEDALERYGLPYELEYLPVIESALRPTATSPVGAAGLWQFMPSTGKHYGLQINTLVDERRDPVKSTDAACRFLSDLYNRFGDWSLAIAAYNCGEGAVQKALARSGGKEGKSFWDIYNYLPKETRGYVPAFIGATYIMNYYCEHGITPMMASLPERADTVVVKKDIRLSKVATACGVSVDQIKALNPQFRQDIVPANYAIMLPAEAAVEFAGKQEDIYNTYSTGTNYAMNSGISSYSSSYKKRSYSGYSHRRRR